MPSYAKFDGALILEAVKRQNFPRPGNNQKYLNKETILAVIRTYDSLAGGAPTEVGGQNLHRIRMRLRTILRKEAAANDLPSDDLAAPVLPSDDLAAPLVPCIRNKLGPQMASPVTFSNDTRQANLFEKLF